MLDGARDSGGDIQRRAHHLAGLANLVRMLDPARVNRRARRTDGATERIGQRFDEGKVLGPLDASSTGNDDVCFGYIELAPRRLVEVTVGETESNIAVYRGQGAEQD